MATFLLLFSKLFTIRPISFILEKIFRKNLIKRSIALEFHFFIITVAYFILFIIGVQEVETVNIICLILGIVGTLCVSYEIFMDNAESMDAVSYTQHAGYTATISGDTVNVRENTKEKLSGATIVALLFSPFNIITRFVNLIISFKTIYADSEYICLLGRYGHATDSTLKKIFVDTVKIADYTDYNGLNYEGYVYYQQEYGKRRKYTNKNASKHYDVRTLIGANGNQMDFYDISRVMYQGKKYAIMQPVKLDFGLKKDQVLVFEVSVDTDGTETFNIVTDQDITDGVIAQYNQ